MKLQLLILTALFTLMPSQSFAQVKPRVAGLAANAEYMQLLERQQELSQRLDSLDTVLTRLREEFRSGGGDAGKILRLENELLEIRAEAGAAAGKISAMEQAFIIANPQSGTLEEKSGKPADTDVGQSADLTANEVFRELLQAADHAGLRRAQSRELDAAGMARRYLINYDKIASLSEAYADAKDAAAADSIYTGYLALYRLNAEIADSLSDVWRGIYDDKLFAYNYLLQTKNQTRLLSRLEAANREVRDQIARGREGAASEEVISYFAQKNLVLDYEKEFAQLFGLTAAADSLERAATAFGSIRRELPEIDVEERYFIEYSEISFHNPAKYDAANPIPEVETPRRGVIYRIQLGSYSAKQAVAIFKGAYPLSYSQSNGKWIYYAGGFAGLKEARTALESLKTRGFRNPQIVVWNGGEALTLDEKPVEGKVYRVEITGGNDGLPERVREAIRQVADGVDIAFSGNNIFIVGPFQIAMDAENAADAARNADPSLSVRTLSGER